MSQGVIPIGIWVNLTCDVIQDPQNYAVPADLKHSF